MDALEAILSRRVQRAFADKPVERDKLAQIVEAGRHAMSARNTQPWQFVVIQNRATLREIGALCSTGKFVADAPSAVVVLKDVGNARWADVDCAQAVQNMANAAWAEGLGTCWVGNFDAAKDRRDAGGQERMGDFHDSAVRLRRPEESTAGQTAQTAR
jgi:nitroreductase